VSRPVASVSAIRWADSSVREFIAAHPAGAEIGEVAQHLGVSWQAVYRSAIRWASIAAVLDAWRERMEAA